MTKVKDLNSEERHLLSPQDRKALIPRVDVFFNTIITSAHTQRTTSKIVMGNKELGYDQVVVAAGENAIVEVGDWVHIDVDKFPKERKPGKHDTGTIEIIHPPLNKIGGTDYLFLTDRHIKWRIQDKTISNVIK